MMCVICIFLLLTFVLVSQVPEEWPIWAREEVGCTVDRHCQSLQTCVEGRCERFWPASLADSKSKCHDTCKHDVELYENYFYSQTVGKFVHFQFRDQCVVAYYPFGTKTERLSQSAYDSQSYQSVVHRERVSDNWIVALCAVVAASQPGLRVAAVAALPAKPTVPGWSSDIVSNKPTVMLGMATRDRPGYVQLTLKALKESTHQAKIFIFDDASTKMSLSDLNRWIDNKAQSVVGVKTKKGPDAMARHILEKFVSSKFDVLVLLDSDQVVAPTWWSSLQKGLRKSTGLLSLYRSGTPKHKSLSCGDVLCTMSSMGNAGTVWRRALAKRMLAAMPNRDGGFDWGWSEWCTKNKVPMEALKESAVLHIGMYGSWSHESTAEKSVGFPMGELAADIRRKAEHFLKGVKPVATALKKISRRGDILWVIPAFKRAWSLDLVLKSLSVHEATKILVSKDADSAEIDSVLKKYTVEAIEHPWSCSRHPNQFPAKDESINENYKGDTYGNPRSPWATCLKHHWWWMMKQAWARKPERVCVLEDDTVIHPQAFEWLDKNKEGNVKLTPEEIAVPWCMSAKEWQAIDSKTFCEHDDYNWDQTIAWMKEHGHGPNEAVVPSVSLSMHVGDCGGWDAGGRDKACTPDQIEGICANVERWLAKPLVIDTTKKKWLTAHTKPNGGWGHPKDWAHCMGEEDKCLQWSNVGGCRHHAASDAWLCKFDWMSMNTNDIHVSKGGSKIRDVLDRPENAEFVRLDKHSIGIPYIPHGPNEWHHKKLISAAMTKKHNCEQTITGTTLFFERIEYANLWHTMNDWFNVHWTLETIGNPPQVTIVWLDGHARGHLDDAWGEIFSARTRYVSEFSGHVCFENAVWVPKNTPVWNTDMPSGRCGIMDRFVQRVLSAYGISASLTEDVVIDRNDYRAHPRHKPDSKNDRIIEHLDKMFPSSKVVQLETMTFKEQVQLIANAKSLRGVHGAGLTHLIWLPDGAEIVEWVAPSHASVKLFEHIATWRPNIHYSSSKMPRLQTPLVEKHRLTILIPFREKISDKKSQGSGREKNLREWLEYMSSFLKMPADVIIVEQSQEGTFNKGFLFNVGFKESQNSDYFVLHDVDQIPENQSNDYAFKKRPTHLLTSTSQWNYKKGPSGNVGGALMITRQKYQEINGYSNNFGGWGREDDNMALRLQKHGGYDRLPPEVGRYKELKHPRVMGLDETEQFHKNVANTNDFTSGLSDLKYEIIASEIKTYGLLRVKRMKVKQSELVPTVKTLSCGPGGGAINNQRVAFYHCLAIARYSKRVLLIKKSNMLVPLHTFPADVQIVDKMISGDIVSSIDILFGQDMHLIIKSGFFSSTYTWLHPVFPYYIEPLLPSSMVHKRITAVKAEINLPDKYQCIHLRTHGPNECWLNQSVPIVQNNCPHLTKQEFVQTTTKWDAIYVSKDSIGDYDSIINVLDTSIYQQQVDVNSNVDSTVDMYICSGAQQFIGHEGSSFSVEIYRHQKNALNYLGNDFQCKTCHCLESGVCNECECEGHVFREKSTKKDSVKIQTTDYAKPEMSPRCHSCKSGDPLDGGIPLINGICVGYCTECYACGLGAAYSTQPNVVDCRSLDTGVHDFDILNQQRKKRLEETDIKHFTKTIVSTTGDCAAMSKTMVTAADKTHERVLDLFLENNAVAHKKYDVQIIVYDLGMSIAGRKYLMDKYPWVHNWPIFAFDQYPEHFNMQKYYAGSYAWKPIITRDVFEKQRGLVLWMDTGVHPQKDSAYDELYNNLCRQGIVEILSSQRVEDWTHPGMRSYFALHDFEKIWALRNNAAGTMLGLKFGDPKANTFVQEWADCALKRDCISPRGSNHCNHRWDQAAMTILTWKIYGTIPITKHHMNIRVGYEDHRPFGLEPVKTLSVREKSQLPLQKHDVYDSLPKVSTFGKKSSSKIPIKYIKLKIGVVLPYHGRHELLKIMSMQSRTEDLVLVQDTGQAFQGFTNVVHSIKHVSHKPIGKSVMEGYDWLYNNGYDIICNLDSDVLVKDNWLKESIRLLEQYPSDIVSAFNEANHLKHCVVQEFDDHYLKNCGGGIHYCFTRELYKTFVQPILTSVETEGDLNFWDAAIVEHIQARGKYIISPKPSLIQHIGVKGFTAKGVLWQVAPDYVLSDEEITLIGDIPELSVLIPKQTADIQTIQTSDLFAAIDFNAPENKGPWKQGWDYNYDGRFKDGLTVHVVPHSHNDPGWINTYHTYYSTQTKHILDTVIAALTEDPRRTFIWAEISYFSLWWNDATQQQKEQAKRLVAEKRLDFVTGGWVMNDEASVTARATRWHLQEGREWLQNTFGITPQYSWAIDPFGHSAGQAQVLKELGYKGMLIQRVHYAVKKQLAEKQQLEFQWQTPAGEIFTHMMPFYSYDGPHTCGPDPSVCCQFDFARIGKGKTWSGCPWGKMAVEITEQNVAERSRTWLDQVYKKAMLYRGKHVFVPVGDDFRYQTMDEAHKQFTNYQKMFDWIKVNVPSLSISFSTLTKYFDAVRETNVPRLKGSFFPYSDRKQDYWTGYFNSRIFYKGYDRLLESLIAAVERKCPSVDIHLQKRAMGLFQHHDGITGTAKTHVVQDYYKTMQKAVIELKSKLKTCLDISSHVLINPLSVDTPTMNANEIRPYEEDACVSVPVAGLHFDAIKIDKHGNILQINKTPIHESLVWRSNKPGQGVAGAYLMSVTPKEDILQPIKHTTCIAKQYKQVETTFDLLKRRIRVYNDGTIEFIYDVDIHARNNGELWAVYKPEWTAERLCSDVHGLTWECHIERKDAPLQAKFWPMPTMAWLSSATKRMTWTGAQPTGVGFHEGAMVLMLDRRGNQDDARGLGQGITDSRPVEMRFGVLMETEISAKHASTKALAIRNWMLNPEIVLHGPI